jgi:hypothetical protein
MHSTPTWSITYTDVKIHLQPSIVELAPGSYDTMLDGKSVEVTKAGSLQDSTWKHLRIEHDIVIKDKLEVRLPNVIHETSLTLTFALTGK